MNPSFKTIIFLVGIAFLLAGTTAAFTSSNAHQSGFDEFSALPNDAIQLLIGAFTAIIGILLMFIGGWSNLKRNPNTYY